MILLYRLFSTRSVFCPVSHTRSRIASQSKKHQISFRYAFLQLAANGMRLGSERVCGRDSFLPTPNLCGNESFDFSPKPFLNLAFVSSSVVLLSYHNCLLLLHFCSKKLETRHLILTPKKHREAFFNSLKEQMFDSIIPSLFNA